MWADAGGASVKGFTGAAPGSGARFHSFQRLPYAEPPLRELRFRPPVARPALPSSGSFDATRDLPACPQFSYRNPEALSKEPLKGQVTDHTLTAPSQIYIHIYI